MTSRALAVDGLLAVLARGLSLDAVLADRRLAELSPEDRALTSAMLYGALRHRLQLEALMDRYLERPLKKRDLAIKMALALGFFQLGWMRIPAHAAVNETVATVRPRWGRGLVNALLRRYEREGRPTDFSDAPDAVRYSHPEWLVQRVRDTWPDDYGAILTANNQQAPMWIRTDRRRVTRDAYARHVASAECPDDAPDAIRLEKPVDISELPGFAEGEVFVQDISAQRAAPLLLGDPAERILDACAAPGGKSVHLQALAPDARLVVVESEEDRLERLRDNLARAGGQAELVHGDATRPEAWWDENPFDAILVDAPCSGSGVIRRHPDIKWLRRESDLDALARTQARLLRSLWPLLARGGRLLYCTCSILAEENHVVVARFLDDQDDACPMPLSLSVGRRAGPGWQVLPGDGGGDGFFYALLGKR